MTHATSPAAWPARWTPGRLGWLLVGLAAVGTALYSVPPYLFYDAAGSRLPLNPERVSHFLWLSLHAVPGSLSLLLGPVQFLPWVRKRHIGVHRWVGRVYLLSVLVGGVTSIVAAVMSVSGLAAQLGFLLLAVTWLYSGWRAYVTVRQGRIDEHRTWMIRNYSLTFAAVLLRVFLATGIIAIERGATLDFAQVYTSSVWCSIFVSYVVGEWFVLRLQKRPAARQPARSHATLPEGEPS